MIDVEQIAACAYKNATTLSNHLQKLKWAKKTSGQEAGYALIDMFVDILISNNQSPFAQAALEGYIENVGLKIENNLKIFLIDKDVPKLHAMQQEIVNEITDYAKVNQFIKGQISLMEKIEASIVQNEDVREEERLARGKRLKENLRVPQYSPTVSKTADKRFKAHRL